MRLFDLGTQPLAYDVTPVLVLLQEESKLVELILKRFDPLLGPHLHSPLLYLLLSFGKHFGLYLVVPHHHPNFHSILDNPIEKLSILFLLFLHESTILFDILIAKYPFFVENFEPVELEIDHLVRNLDEPCNPLLSDVLCPNVSPLKLFHEALNSVGQNLLFHAFLESNHKTLVQSLLISVVHLSLRVQMRLRIDASIGLLLIRFGRELRKRLNGRSLLLARARRFGA